MKTKDRAIAGKIYLAVSPGTDILTGLSRRRGGRCSGRRVYCFFSTAGKVTGLSMPGRYTTTGTFPATRVVEKDRFGVEVLGAVGTVVGKFLWENVEAFVEALGRLGAGGSSPATVS